MERIGLELSDVGLLAAGGTPPALYKLDQERAESPGVALQSKNRLLTGWEAYGQSRLHPRQCTNRFWSMLSTEPLQERALSAQNYAELAYAHLERVVRAIPVPEPAWTIAAPDFMDQGKLGVLLGVARALGMRVEGIVANAVAAAQPSGPGASIIHLDAHLHRLELTWLRQDQRLRRETTYLITDAGWERLVDDVAGRFADEFVRSTRFDPLHDAAAEQALINQVTDLLLRPPRGHPMALELKLGRSTYRISVSAQLAVEASRSLRTKVVHALEELRAEAAGPEGAVEVQLSHRAARIPGLPEAVGGVPGLQGRVLAPGAGALGALAMARDLAAETGPGGVVFLASRQVEAAAEPPPVPAAAVPEQPTHLLAGHVAYPIADAPLAVVRTAGDVAVKRAGEAADDRILCRVRLRDGRAWVEPGPEVEVRLGAESLEAPRALAPGDRLQMDPEGVELTLIQVRSHGAT